MKKGKLNNGGFVLVETLIVSVFVVGIFAILYNNLYPLIGEYEKREVYDDIDGKYATYWIKRVIQHDSTVLSASCSDSYLTGSPGYCQFNCNMVGNESMKAMCNEIVKQAQVKVTSGTPHIYITTYNLTNFKSRINNSSSFSGGMHKYVKYLPYYKWDSLNNAKYRVIVEFHRTKDGNNYVAYSTFEVKK